VDEAEFLNFLGDLAALEAQAPLPQPTPAPAPAPAPAPSSNSSSRSRSAATLRSKYGMEPAELTALTPQACRRRFPGNPEAAAELIRIRRQLMNNEHTRSHTSRKRHDAEVHVEGLHAQMHAMRAQMAQLESENEHLRQRIAEYERAMPRDEMLDLF
jgi:hypothetical protein